AMSRAALRYDLLERDARSRRPPRIQPPRMEALHVCASSLKAKSGAAEQGSGGEGADPEPNDLYPAGVDKKAIEDEEVSALIAASRAESRMVESDRLREAVTPRALALSGAVRFPQREAELNSAHFFRYLEDFKKEQSHSLSSALGIYPPPPPAGAVSHRASSPGKQSLPVVAPVLRPLEGNIKSRIWTSESASPRSRSPSRSRQKNSLDAMPFPAPRRMVSDTVLQERYGYAAFCLSESWAPRSPISCKLEFKAQKPAPPHLSTTQDILTATNQILLDLPLPRYASERSAHALADNNFGWSMGMRAVTNRPRHIRSIRSTMPSVRTSGVDTSSLQLTSCSCTADARSAR
ncbi:MAG: hypothetical protein SGPRY_010366, partial [Prymnesium sp.]